MKGQQFVIRVYAIIINDKQEILLSDEFINNTLMTQSTNMLIFFCSMESQYFKNYSKK